jgi:hypothetical protein
VRVRLAIAFLAAGLAPALSQTASPGLSPVAPQQQTIKIPNSTPEQLQAAEDLVAATGLASSILGVIPTLMGQINSTVTTTRPELAGDMKKAFDALAPEFGTYPRDMVTGAARVYTAMMSPQEIKDALAFFRTPVGKKFIDAQPTIIGNVNPAIRAWQQQMSVKMMDRVREEMKKLGHDI